MIPWALLMSLVPLIVLLTFLIGFEYRSSQRHKAIRRESRECIRPIARIADRMHKKKFGAPSDEIAEVFPDMKVVK